MSRREFWFNLFVSVLLLIMGGIFMYLDIVLDLPSFAGEDAPGKHVTCVGVCSFLFFAGGLLVLLLMLGKLEEDTKKERKEKG